MRGTGDEEGWEERIMGVRPRRHERGGHPSQKERKTHALLDPCRKRCEALREAELEPERAHANGGPRAAYERRRVDDGARPAEVVRVRGLRRSANGHCRRAAGRRGGGRRGGRGERRGSVAHRRRGGGAQPHLQRTADERHAADEHAARAAAAGLGQQARSNPARHAARGRQHVERVVVIAGAVVKGRGLELPDDRGSVVELVGRLGGCRRRLGLWAVAHGQRGDARAQLRRQGGEPALCRVQEGVARGLVLRARGRGRSERERDCTCVVGKGNGKGELRKKRVFLTAPGGPE